MSKSNNKLGQLQLLEIGNGIQYLLDEAYKIFGNPILMHDLDYKVIGLTENIVTDDPLWNELQTTGRHSMETVETFKNDYLIDIATNAKITTILAGDTLKYKRLFGKVFNKHNIIVAGVDLVECYKPFEDCDYEAFEVFCRILSKEISEIEFYNHYGKVYLENLIKRLVEGDIEDKRLYPFHVNIIYNSLKRNLYLAVVDFTQHSDKCIEYCKNLLENSRLSFLYTKYSNYVIVLISSDTKLNEKEDLTAFRQIFVENNINAGISSCFQNLYDLQRYYHEAVKALNYGLKKNSEQRIFLYSKVKRYLPN